MTFSGIIDHIVIIKIIIMGIIQDIGIFGSIFKKGGPR